MIKVCLNCKKEYKAPPAHNKKFHSFKCYRAYAVGVNANKPWLGKTRSIEDKLKFKNSHLTIRSPNKKEVIIQGLLDELHRNEWKFVGDGALIIEGKNPDFVNVNGKKLLIEFFGNHWHPKGDEADRINTFAKYGYRTLVIWQTELKDMDKLKEKIKVFN